MIEKIGYMYAFYNQHYSFLKVGFTSKNDTVECRSRISDYGRVHGLNQGSWEMVTFLRCKKPMEVEQKVHFELRHMRANHGSATEIFHCSPDLFAGLLMKLSAFIDLQSASGGTTPHL